jgi:hypothetical protein
MSDVSLSRQGPPETILPAEAAEIIELLRKAETNLDVDVRRKELNSVAVLFPNSIEVWKTLGRHGRDSIESYAAYRVGYHRGLDALRKNGWRGSGYVRWHHTSNQAFLSCLAGVQTISEAIDDLIEAERCYIFLLQLEPAWPSISIE